MLKKMDKILLISSSVLFIFGLIMIFSASSVTAYNKGLTPDHYFIRQLLFIGVGSVLSFFIMIFNLKTEGRISSILIPIVFAALFYLLLWGKPINDAKSWFFIGDFTLQPSEFYKIISIVWIPFMIFEQKMFSGWAKYGIVIFFVLFGAFFIAFEPDLGTALIYCFICLTLFFVINENVEIKSKLLKTGGIFAVVLLLAGAVLINSNPDGFQRQIGRFSNWLSNPCSEENFYDTGTQKCNGYIAFNNGGLTGKGLGDSTQKYLYLPEAYSDFVFPVVVEEMGFITGIIVLLLMGVVLFRIFRIAKKSNSDYGKVICIGVFIYILLHILVNLGGIIGLLPLTGVPLPFLSYGGSFTLCLFAGIAFVQRVAIETCDVKTKKVKDK